MAFPPQGTGSNIGDIASAVWAFTNRRLTRIDLQPRIDLMGEDASFEAGSGARKSRIDKIVTLEPIGEGTIAADGNEQEVVERTALGTVEGYIDLANMQVGDTVLIREYIRVLSGGPYRLYATGTYQNVQPTPAIHNIELPTRYGLRVTLQQTAGVNRNYPWGFFRRLIA